MVQIDGHRLCPSHRHNIIIRLVTLRHSLLCDYIDAPMCPRVSAVLVFKSAEEREKLPVFWQWKYNLE